MHMLSLLSLSSTYTHTHVLYIVACRDPLLGNDHETNNETTSAARQQIPSKQQLNSNRRTVSSVRSVARYYDQDK
jgi:hypothetical protein